MDLIGDSKQFEWIHGKFMTTICRHTIYQKKENLQTLVRHRDIEWVSGHINEKVGK